MFCSLHLKKKVDSLLGVWCGCDMFEKVARSVALTCMATGSLIRKIVCLPSSDVVLLAINHDLSGKICKSVLLKHPISIKLKNYMIPSSISINSCFHSQEAATFYFLLRFHLGISNIYFNRNFLMVSRARLYLDWLELYQGCERVCWGLKKVDWLEQDTWSVFGIVIAFMVMI
jgi:hypothetical protein